MTFLMASRHAGTRTGSLLLLATALVCVTVHAQEPASSGGVTLSRAVRFDDLNLDTEAGAKRLYRRLESTAKTVCEARRAYSPEYIKAVLRPCLASAMNDAVAGVNAPLLTAYHRERTGSVQADAKVAER